MFTSGAAVCRGGGVVCVWVCVCVCVSVCFYCKSVFCFVCEVHFIWIKIRRGYGYVLIVFLSRCVGGVYVCLYVCFLCLSVSVFCFVCIVRCI